MNSKYQPSQIGPYSSGINKTYWLDSAGPLLYDALGQDVTVDVVIVGGGIAGISCAYALSKEGKTVAVVEDGHIGSGETGRTTAHLVTALDDRYTDIENMFGEEKARLVAESHAEAINFIERTVKEENIDCDFARVNGYLFLHETDDVESLKEEFEASHRAGVICEYKESTPGVDATGSPCLLFPDQAQFHVLKYLKGLCEQIQQNGGKIYTNTHAEDISKEGITTSDGKTIRAKHVIVATNTPVNNMVNMHTKQAPYRSYVVNYKIPKGSLEKALWWDTGNQESVWPTFPYHYVRTQELDETHDLLIVGGEDHKTGQADTEDLPEEQRYQNLEKWTRRHFPMAGEMLYKWSGQIMEPADALGYIGRNPGDADNVYIVTGDSGMGMTHSTIAAILIPDLIAGRTNAWEELYDPSRSAIRAVKEFVEENLNVAKQYGDLVTQGDVPSLNDLKPGEGAVLRDGLSKVAAYKDDNGQVHTHTAICPHLGCVVQWNADEKSFDCPCHGSRFSCFGKVLNGPANGDLDEVKM